MKALRLLLLNQLLVIFSLIDLFDAYLYDVQIGMQYLFVP